MQPQANYGEPEIAAIGHNNPPTEAEILKARLDTYTEEQAELKRLSERKLPEKIDNEGLAGELTLHLKAIKSLESKFEAAHKKEKAPILEATNIVDGWKREQLAITAKLKKSVEPLIQAWLDHLDKLERDRQFAIAQKAREDAERLRAESKAHEKEDLVYTATELLEAAHQEEAKAEAITINVMDAKPGSLATARTIGASASQKAPWVGRIENIVALDLEKLRPYFTEDSLQKALNAFVRDGGRQLNGAIIAQEKNLSIR